VQGRAKFEEREMDSREGNAWTRRDGYVGISLYVMTAFLNKHSNPPR
jgi:hypothetical protein